VKVPGHGNGDQGGVVAEGPDQILAHDPAGRPSGSTRSGLVSCT